MSYSLIFFLVALAAYLVGSVLGQGLIPYALAVLSILSAVASIALALFELWARPWREEGFDPKLSDCAKDVAEKLLK